MRQLSALTNLVLACAAAVGLVLGLKLPWFAPVLSAPEQENAVGQLQGPMDETAALVERIFSSSGPAVTGAEAYGTLDVVVLALAGVTVLLAALCAVPVLRGLVRDLLRMVPLVAPLLLIVNLVSPPAGLELRWGSFAAIGIAALMASAAWQGGTQARVARTQRALGRAPGMVPPAA